MPAQSLVSSLSEYKSASDFVNKIEATRGHPTPLPPHTLVLAKHTPQPAPSLSEDEEIDHFLSTAEKLAWIIQDLIASR